MGLVCYTLEADKKLKELGINAEIIDLRTIRPIDFDTIIDSSKKDKQMCNGRGIFSSLFNRKLYWITDYDKSI